MSLRGERSLTKTWKTVAVERLQEGELDRCDACKAGVDVENAWSITVLRPHSPLGKAERRDPVASGTARRRRDVDRLSRFQRASEHGPFMDKSLVHITDAAWMGPYLTFRRGIGDALHQGTLSP